MRYLYFILLLSLFLCGCGQNKNIENSEFVLESKSESVIETDFEEIVLTTAPATAPEIDFEVIPEPETESRFLSWQIAYRDLILEHFTGQECSNFKYALVYVDDNKIPELFINTQDETSGKIIYSYFDDNLNTAIDAESSITPIEEYTLEEILIRITGDYQ